MKNAHKAIKIVSRTMPEVVRQFAKSGNPVVRHAAQCMTYLAGMPDQCTAQQHQAAEDVLYYLPMAEIEQCCKLAGL